MDSFFGLAREKLEKERLTEAKAVSQLLTTVDAYDNKRNVGRVHCLIRIEYELA